MLSLILKKGGGNMKKSKKTSYAAAAAVSHRKTKIDWMTVTVFVVVALFAAVAAYHIGRASVVNAPTQMQESVYTQ